MKQVRSEYFITIVILETLSITHENKSQTTCQLPSHIHRIKCPVLAQSLDYSLKCERHYCDSGENVS